MKTQYWQNAIGTVEITSTLAEIGSLAVRAAYLPAVIFGVGPLLPIIGLIYVAKWIDDGNGGAEVDRGDREPETQPHLGGDEQLDMPPDA
jgi:hypothetical protein